LYRIPVIRGACTAPISTELIPGALSRSKQVAKYWPWQRKMAMKIFLKSNGYVLFDKRA
jgi:hypothetical protein